MSKVLEIKGCKESFIVEACKECPLAYVNSEGAIYCNHPEAGYVLASINKCPLPDATEAHADVWPDDENHRLGPKGERLIAVEGEEEDCNDCYKCFYAICDGDACTCEVTNRMCSSSKRKDGRTIHWELAGDRT